MAKEPEATRLSADQLKECLATGASLSDVRSLQAEGHSFEDIQEILEITKEEREKTEERHGNRLAAAVSNASAPDRIPENKFRHPRMSVYNPKGEFHAKVNPKGITRPVPTCETFWNGVLIEGDVDTNDEIELSNAITQPGEYYCTKNDGGTFRVTVGLEYGPDRITPSRKLIAYDYKGKSRDYPSKAAIAREVIAKQAEASHAPA